MARMDLSVELVIGSCVTERTWRQECGVPKSLLWRFAAMPEASFLGKGSALHEQLGRGKERHACAKSA